MRKILAAILFATLVVIGAQAQTYTTNTYSQTVNTIVPDDNPNGVFSTINVSGLYGTIAGINVSLDLTNGWVGDYYCYLVNSNGGAFSVLLNRVGVQSGDSFGYGDTGFHVTFDLSSTNIHFYQNSSYTLDGNGALLGTWGADGRNVDPASDPAVLGSTTPTVLLDQFLDTDPNGTWTLFLADMSGGFEGTWQDWQINLVTVPEPATISILAIAAVSFAVYVRRRSVTRMKTTADNG